MKQIELLRKAVSIAEENPDIGIHVLASSEEILPDYLWTAHHIKRVELGYWYEDNERIYTDPDELAEELSDVDDVEATVEDAIRIMKRAILIYTGA